MDAPSQPNPITAQPASELPALTWTEHAPNGRASEHEHCARIMAVGHWGERYQESSSWWEAVSFYYRILCVGFVGYVVVYLCHSFNNDGMDEEYRASYEGDDVSEACPHVFDSILEARAAADLHFSNSVGGSEKATWAAFPLEETDDESEEGAQC